MNAVPLHSPSGHPEIDRQWGGLAPGSTTLLIGRASAGRSGLALQTAGAALANGERCLLISPRPPATLAETAKGMGVDLAGAHGAGLLRLLRIPAPADLAARGDNGLAASYREFVGLVQSGQPARVVVEDFTPLVQFSTFERFQEAFTGLIGDLRDLGVVFVLGLGEPANDSSQHLLTVVQTLVDGTVRVGTDGDLSLERSSPHIPEAEEDAPEDQDAAAPFSTNDGASVETDGPTPTPTPHGPAPDTEEAPPTAVVAPPPVDPSLLAPVGDAFANSQIEEIMEHGFLIDSGHVADPTVAVPVGKALPLSSLTPSSRAAAPPTLPAPAPAAPAAVPAPAASEPPPSFTPLRKVEPAAAVPEPTAPADSAEAFHQSLGAAFEARAEGTPFLVVALRVDPSTLEAAHFEAIDTALRTALRDADRLLSDLGRKRAVVLLPDSRADAGQPLFDGLRAHLQSTLGFEAEAVLGAIGAVTIPDGQPFTSAADLLAYAFEG